MMHAATVCAAPPRALPGATFCQTLGTRTPLGGATCVGSGGDQSLFMVQRIFGRVGVGHGAQTTRYAPAQRRLYLKAPFRQLTALKRPHGWYWPAHIATQRNAT